MAAAARRVLALLALLVATLLGGHAERYAVRPHGPAAGRVRRRAAQLLSSAALLAAAGGLGAQAQEAREDSRAVFAALDVNADGAVTPEEFSAYELPEAANLEDKGPFLQKLFNFADLDGDGILSDAEARYVNFVVNAGFSPSTSKDRGLSKAMSVVTTYDQGGDGLLDGDEYRAWVVSQGDDWGMDVASAEFAEWAESTFSTADITGDNQLMAKEVHYAMYLHEQSHYIMQKAICDILAKMLVKEYDADGDEKLNGEETEVLVTLAAAHPGDSAGERVFGFFAAGFDEGAEEDEPGASAAPMADVDTGPVPTATAADAAPTEELRALFASADADGDGSLDVEEMSQLAQRLSRENR